MPAKKTMYAVDASGLIHRAFHAIRHLRNSKGLPTNALYGFATMLRRFTRENSPEYCVIVFDAGRVTFRNEIYPAYKANRPPADPDLVAQFPYARRLAEAMGFPIIEIEGFEADDIIATISTHARSQGFGVVIESSDKDLLQLVGEGVLVHDPVKDVQYDRDGVKAKMGVPPELVRDLLALMGDSSDNVPGVTGIGPKGAAELINAYGPLEEIYRHLDDLTPKRRMALENGRDDAFLSRKLVTLRTDVPLGRDLSHDCADLKLNRRHDDELLELLTELEFKSLVDELVAGGRVRVETSEVRALEAADTADLERALSGVEPGADLSLIAAFGVRNPVHPDCRGLAIGLSPDTAVTVNPSRLDPSMVAELVKRLGRARLSVSNYKEVHQFIGSLGVEAPLPVMDPVLGGYLLHPEKESPTLDSLAMEIINQALPVTFEPAALAKRACAAFEICSETESRLEDAGLLDLLREIEIPVARVLSEMETLGVKVDRDSLRDMSVQFGRELQRLEGEIIREAGFPFNPNSPKQLAQVLFDTMKLPVIK
ncbi:MAG: hypothetical protein GXP54_06890, partial [Deltaproteobacteria bacterium]|nr:hypothetical protein [Deltaproteobacteria bacterium]